VTSDPDFKVTTFFEIEYRKKRHVLKTQLLLHKRKLYLTYGLWNGTMFGDLTFTDLYTRHAGLSASIELLVELSGQWTHLQTDTLT